MKKKITYLALPLTVLLMTGCANEEDASTELKVEERIPTETAPEAKEDVTELKKEATPVAKVVKETPEKTTPKKDDSEEKTDTTQQTPATNNDPFAGYTQIQVDGGDLSGSRQANVVVDIGFGDRKYWAFTNKHGQLVKVIAKKIILQNDATEDVTSAGRYYHDEAKVPGVEHRDLDEGHVIADSLGGVSNAYNITPQDSTLNRHGDQAYMEDNIRKAGGATNFEAIITYETTNTQIPSSYKYTYTLKGNVIVDKFDNVNPDGVNASLGLTENKESKSKAEPKTKTPTKPKSEPTGDVSSVDTNGNGQVTIQEAKDAGFSMPIRSDHWLYPYMRDNDHDGMVGE
ncbi:DNA/RNA non-specific endonuclease [Exiguobacterium sp. s193]|uniref:DNA/RNA non-specific endonuclease n=1 Tax=Exiguobacterium sp. s193 TaxID=2751207 RepID=UPI001BE95290|nr:DNA/RNA non-specific endonuclease [Exiguobacterium sp. s193]